MNDSEAGGQFPFVGDRYAIDARLGVGATGRVYRARDRQLDRPVAIKILDSGDIGDVERFTWAARAQARIDHEHVGRVFEVGVVDGKAFLAMQLVDGRSLRDLVSGLDLRARVMLLEQAARAVRAAHLAGVVHRDLKPGNIMVEQRPDGNLHAVVLDFGIARDWSRCDDVDAAESTGAPAFAAPELLRGEPDGTEPAVDVYGLGATLYGVLAEQAPFFGANRDEVRRKVIEEDPVPLGLAVPGTPEDLETIVSVAMAKDPARRYPSVGALADDLARWLRGEPIRALASGPVYLAGTWLKTRWAAVTAAAVAVTLVGVGTVSVLRARQQAERRRELIAEYQHEVEEMDRVLRRARMMPAHDLSDAEAEVRRHLAAVEASLLEYGPLARGPAYYALGFGHLMLREFPTAEQWLQAAVDSGFSAPEVESALGISIAMQVLEDGRSSADRGRIDDAVRHLAARGPVTAERDTFHRALGLFVSGRLDAALEAARASAAGTPWLYEAYQLEGDVLVARSTERWNTGDTEGAVADLREAGRAYRTGLAVARSDPWLAEAESARQKRLEWMLAQVDAEGRRPE